MYLNVNEEYRALMRDGKLPSNTSITGTMKLVNGTTIQLDNTNLMTNSLNINNKCSGAGTLEIGSVYVGCCTFKFRTNLYLYDLYDAKVTLYYNACDNVIPLGVFYVTEATRTSQILSITAYDCMNNFDDAIGNLTVNGEPYYVLNWLAKECGVEIKNTKEEIEAMENGKAVCNVSNNAYSTFREALSDLAAMLGGFATINRFGQLEIRQFKIQPNGTLYTRQRKGQKIAEYKTKITELDVTVDGTTFKAIVGKNDGLAYALSNKMINGVVSTVQTEVDNIMDVLKGLEYTPASYSIVYDPTYDLGDMIEVYADGTILKEKIKTVITSFSYTFQGASTIEGVGENIFLSKRNKTAASTSYDSATAYAKNNGTYIETYENVEPYTIGNTQKNVVAIDYANGTSDCVVLHGQMCINVTTVGYLQLIYGHDGEYETFSPIQTISKTGPQIIDFYCYYRDVEKNWLSTYTVDVKFTDDKVGAATIDIGAIRADVMATMYGAGKFITDNGIYNESIPYMTLSAKVSIGGSEDGN